jgi:hypothetical protein
VGHIAAALDLHEEFRRGGFRAPQAVAAPARPSGRRRRARR